MLVSGDYFSDLLIFKGKNANTGTDPKKNYKLTIQPQQADRLQSKDDVQPQAGQAPQQVSKNQKSSEDIRAEKPNVTSNVFCINHPWREAYGYCAKDGLPYCYVDLIEYGGKAYCLNDIDSALRNEGESIKVEPKNGFSAMSSVLLFANAAVLLYFTRSQIAFITSLALKQGVISFLLNLNSLYIFPIANIAVVVLAVFAAIAILGRSLSLFAFAFFVTFGSLLIMIYQYLSNSVVYSLISSVVLLIAVSAMVYSRMSAVSASSEKYLATQEIDWPKPEVF